MNFLFGVVGPALIVFGVLCPDWCADKVNRIRFPRTAMGQFFLTANLLSAILLMFFWPALMPGKVMFSNDGPLGIQVADKSSLANGWGTAWDDLNWLGTSGVGFSFLTVLVAFTVYGFAVLMAFMWVKWLRSKV